MSSEYRDPIFWVEFAEGKSDNFSHVVIPSSSSAKDTPRGGSLVGIASAIHHQAFFWAFGELDH